MSAISYISAITVFFHVVFGHPDFLRPGGVHLTATSGILYLGILKTCPSHLIRRRLISRTTLLQPVEFHVSYFIGPEYPADISQTCIVEGPQEVHKSKINNDEVVRNSKISEQSEHL